MQLRSNQSSPKWQQLVLHIHCLPSLKGCLQSPGTHLRIRCRFHREKGVKAAAAARHLVSETVLCLLRKVEDKLFQEGKIGYPLEEEKL
ncbi:hypothetical protein FQN60_006768 [Etheostoma spectabile]|uniref:Uncharacterized protein n=1 Tax=Etheostoma spectabile TaxID=54343 RepID=A0A5J5CF64_9PERO|nr:hypothetical protein FQN60_006768 [Etheostoma spectabile]